MLLLRENRLGVIMGRRIGCLREGYFLDFGKIEIFVSYGCNRFLFSRLQFITILITNKLLLSLKNLLREKVYFEGGRNDCNLRGIESA